MTVIFLVGDHWQYDGGQDVLGAFTTRSAAEAFINNKKREFDARHLAYRLEITEVELDVQAQEVPDPDPAPGPQPLP